jgi:hypothetical protein
MSFGKWQPRTSLPQLDGALLLNVHPTLHGGKDRARREGDDVEQFVATGPGHARIDQID